MATRILVTRPGNPGLELVEKLGYKSLSVRHGPTLVIEALPLNPLSTEYDAIIYISRTAVEASVSIDPEFGQRGKKVFAVGPGTAKTLQQAGVTKVIIPESFNSEGLLALPELSEVMSQRILIVKGEGGRPLLGDTLISRGAKIDYLDVYRRRAIAIEPEVWDWFWSGKNERIVTCASIETLEAFDAQRIASEKPQTVTICVASDRIAEACRRLGYTKIISAGGAANKHFVAALNQLTDV